MKKLESALCDAWWSLRSHFSFISVNFVKQIWPWIKRIFMLYTIISNYLIQKWTVLLRPRDPLNHLGSRVPTCISVTSVLNCDIMCMLLSWHFLVLEKLLLCWIRNFVLDHLISYSWAAAMHSFWLDMRIHLGKDLVRITARIYAVCGEMEQCLHNIAPWLSAIAKLLVVSGV